MVAMAVMQHAIYTEHWIALICPLTGQQIDILDILCFPILTLLCFYTIYASLFYAFCFPGVTGTS